MIFIYDKELILHVLAYPHTHTAQNVASDSQAPLALLKGLSYNRTLHEPLASNISVDEEILTRIAKDEYLNWGAKILVAEHIKATPQIYEILSTFEHVELDRIIIIKKDLTDRTLRYLKRSRDLEVRKKAEEYLNGNKRA